MKYDPIAGVLKRLRSIVGGWAFNALMEGRPLTCWKDTIPHNWFIEKADKTGYLWHSHPEGVSEGRFPSLKLFTNTYRDPQISKYLLKEEYRRFHRKRSKGG